MATSTNGNKTSKIVRIQKDEKELLSKLRGIYGNNYRKYFLYIRRGSDIPLSIKKSYKLLDERKAYRRISDYFHRERTAKKIRSSKPSGHHKSGHRASTRHHISDSQSTSAEPVDYEMYDEDDEDDENLRQRSTNSTITNNNEERNETNHRIDDEIQDIQPSSSSITITPQPKRRLSLMNNPQQQSINTSISQSSLLSIRASIQKALRELDNAIILKSDVIPIDCDDEQQRSLVPIPNDPCHSKLDDLVRSLSTVVHNQQENVRLIINETSALLVHENPQPPTDDSIQHILDRLNTLVDRGHSVYDRIENILSEF